MSAYDRIKAFAERIDKKLSIAERAELNEIKGFVYHLAKQSERADEVRNEKNRRQNAAYWEKRYGRRPPIDMTNVISLPTRK